MSFIPASSQAQSRGSTGAYPNCCKEGGKWMDGCLLLVIVLTLQSNLALFIILFISVIYEIKIKANFEKMRKNLK